MLIKSYTIVAVLADGKRVPADMRSDLGMRISYEKNGRLPLLSSGEEGLKSFTQMAAEENGAMSRMTESKRRAYYGKDIVCFAVLTMEAEV